MAKDEMTAEEKLNEVERIRKLCVKKVRDILDDMEQVKVKISMYDLDGQDNSKLFDASLSMEWTDYSSGELSWTESKEDFGCIVIFQKDRK